MALVLVEDAGLGSWFSSFTGHQDHLEGELNSEVLGPSPRVPDSVDLG